MKLQRGLTPKPPCDASGFPTLWIIGVAMVLQWREFTRVDP